MKETSSRAKTDPEPEIGHAYRAYGNQPTGAIVAIRGPLVEIDFRDGHTHIVRREHMEFHKGFWAMSTELLTRLSNELIEESMYVH